MDAPTTRLRSNQATNYVLDMITQRNCSILDGGKRKAYYLRTTNYIPVREIIQIRVEGLVGRH